jgi:methionine aminopeptidase
MQLMLMLLQLLMNIMVILVECFVGKTSVKLNNLIDTTYESMMRAIKILKPGIRLGDIGYEIQSSC